MAYDDEIVLEAKRRIVQHGHSPEQVSAYFGDTPAASTIALWSREGRLADKPWPELRTEYAQSLMTDTSPATLARGLYQDLQQIMEEMPAGSKKADAVAKYAVNIMRLLEPKMRVNMMYETLEELIAFLKANAAGTLSKELLHAFRDFKNDLRTRLMKQERNR